MLGATKKVPLSGEVRLGNYVTERPGDLISHNLINCLSPELHISLPHYSKPILLCSQFHWLRLGSGVG